MKNPVKTSAIKAIAISIDNEYKDHILNEIHIHGAERQTKTYFINNGYIYRYVDVDQEPLCISSCINQYEADLLIGIANAFIMPHDRSM